MPAAALPAASEAVTKKAAFKKKKRKAVTAQDEPERSGEVCNKRHYDFVKHPGAEHYGAWALAPRERVSLRASWLYTLEFTGDGMTKPE